jgi:hypothetical protein
MTIGSVTVNIQVAFPQGLTKDQVRERIVEILAEQVAPEAGVIEFEVGEVIANADPFGVEFQKKLKNLASGLNAHGPVFIGGEAALQTQPTPWNGKG